MNEGQSDRGIQDIQTLVRYYLRAVILPGDIVVDATAGRGKDTLFLARCVGASGRVFSFDIQDEAILSTRELLKEYGLSARVELVNTCHSEMAKYIPIEKIKAIVFNLGYLPGSESKVATQAQTTVKALTEALKLLKETGVMVITVYRGHDGALEESEAITNFLSRLPKKEFSVLQGIYLNQGEQSPYWLMIQKNRGKTNESPPAKKNSGTDNQ